MNRVERHIVIQSKQLENACHLSKNLYNYVNYLLRQHFIETGLLLSEYKLTGQLAKEKQVDYIALPAQVSQQIIKLIFKNWKSFFKANKEYKKNPKKFKGRPRLPKYKDKDGLNIVIFTNQCSRIKNSEVHFAKELISPVKTNVQSHQQVRIIPKATCFVIEIVYEKEIKNYDLNKENFLSIDLGLTNLVATFNNVGEQPFIINGRIVKSINQYFNKKKAKLMSYIGDKGTSNRIRKLSLKRDNKIQNYLHHTSKFIITYCIERSIGKIIIGNNKDWKQYINLGKKTNQSFVSIPFSKLVQQLQYKAEEAGIEVILTEESYTSKIDHLANEIMEHKENYLGKRVKRGLFQSSTKKLINADVNGAIGIARKVISNSPISGITNRGLGFNPVKVCLNTHFNKNLHKLA